jgi:hypothetical protein
MPSFQHAISPWLQLPISAAFKRSERALWRLLPQAKDILQNSSPMPPAGPGSTAADLGISQRTIENANRRQVISQPAVASSSAGILHRRCIHFRKRNCTPPFQPWLNATAAP